MYPTEDQISPSLSLVTESSHSGPIDSAVTSDDPVRGLSDVTVPVTEVLPSDDPVRGLSDVTMPVTEVLPSDDPVRWLSDEPKVNESANDIDIPCSIPETINVDNLVSDSVSSDSESVSEDEIIICQLNSSSLLHVQVLVNTLNCTAVVDSAAEVTLISDRVYKLKPMPEVLKKLHTKTAGRDITARMTLIY